MNAVAAGLPRTYAGRGSSNSADVLSTFFCESFTNTDTKHSQSEMAVAARASSFESRFGPTSPDPTRGFKKNKSGFIGNNYLRHCISRFKSGFVDIDTYVRLVYL
jgi:hypothetical protein